MNEKTTLLIVGLVSLISPLFLIQIVHAESGDINLLDVPQALGEKLGIGTFAGGLLACCILILIVVLPSAMLLRGSRHTTIVVLAEILALYSFCTAIVWIPVWTLIVLCFILALIFAKDIKGIFK